MQGSKKKSFSICIIIKVKSLLNECLQYILNAMHITCTQLWCAAGVNINNYQPADSVMSSYANSASSAAQSAVCELLLNNRLCCCIVSRTLFLNCLLK